MQGETNGPAEAAAPPRGIRKIKLGEPECSVREVGSGIGVVCDLGSDAIKKINRGGLPGGSGGRVMMWNSTSFTPRLLPGSKQTKRTSHASAVTPWRVRNQSREERRGEGKVRNALECKGHKFNTSCARRKSRLYQRKVTEKKMRKWVKVTWMRVRGVPGGRQRGWTKAGAGGGAEGWQFGERDRVLDRTVLWGEWGRHKN